MVHCCDKICHEKPESKDPESFPHKKAHFSKISKQSSSLSLDKIFALDSRSDETDPSLSSSLDAENVASNNHNPSECVASDIETSDSNSNSSDFHDPSECEINTPNIETSESNYFDFHDTSECEIKVPGVETSDPNSDEIEFHALNCPAFVIDFDEKSLEDHPKAVIRI